MTQAEHKLLAYLRERLAEAERALSSRGTAALERENERLRARLQTADDRRAFLIRRQTRRLQTVNETHARQVGELRREISRLRSDNNTLQKRVERAKGPIAPADWRRMPRAERQRAIRARLSPQRAA